MGQREHLMERAIEVAGSLLFFFVSLKQEVGIITTGSIRGSDRPPAEPARAGVGHAIGILGDAGARHRRQGTDRLHRPRAGIGA